MSEYWIQDGQAVGADGDVGDYNHEAMVIEAVQYKIMDGYNDELGWESWKELMTREIVEEKIEKLKQKLKFLQNETETQDIEKKIEELQEIFLDPSYYAYQILLENLDEINATEEELDIAEGHGDARKYGMEHYGWKRVENRNVETWKMNKSELHYIAEGLYDIYDEQIENMKFNIYVYNPQVYYLDVPWDIINEVNLLKLREYNSFTRFSNSNWYKKLV